jgi:hypothetical protein
MREVDPDAFDGDTIPAGEGLRRSTLYFLDAV